MMAALYLLLIQLPLDVLKDKWAISEKNDKNVTLGLIILAHLCLCTMGSYASLSVRLSVCHWTKTQGLENNSYLKKHPDLT